METVSIDLYLHDIAAIRLAGIDAPETGTIQALPAAIPAIGDVVTHADLSYASGERARFQVVSRAHLFGGTCTHRIQLNLQLVVLHQP